MSIAAILFPDFALIAGGWMLRRWGGFSDPFWSQLERLIYFVLFPALLFNALVRARIDVAAAGPLLATGVSFSVAGMLLGYAARFIFRLPPMVFASGFQCAFRFNSYVGFAVMNALFKEDGIAAAGVLLGVLIPLVNAASVWTLARHGNGSVVREIVRNPLIIATVAGIGFVVAGLRLPEVIGHTLNLVAQASLPLGLIAVGAGLRLERTGAHRLLIGYLAAVKLLAVPLVALLIARQLGLHGPYLYAAVVVAALPPAPASYILAVRMGGEGGLVATLIALCLAAAAFTLPLWLALAAR